MMSPVHFIIAIWVLSGAGLLFVLRRKLVEGRLETAAGGPLPS